MKSNGCRHRAPLVITPARYAWTDGELLDPPIRKVECSSCAKRWTVGLSRGQRSRLLRLRPSGDRRSPYELGPELLKELP